MLKRLSFLAAIAVAAMPAAVQTAQAQSRPPAGAPLTDADRAEFERALRMSEGSAILEAMERHFPADYRRLVDRMFTEAMAVYPNESAMAAVGMQVMEGFIAEKLPAIVNAPAPLLLALNDRQVEMFRGMRSVDPAICADAVQGIVRDPTTVPAVARALAARVTLAIVEAAGAGAKAAPRAGRGEMQPADAQAWVGQIASMEGGTRILQLLQDPAAMRAASPQEQCSTGIAIQEAVRRLPAESGANLVAAFTVTALRNRGAAVPASPAPPPPAPAPTI